MPDGEKIVPHNLRRADPPNWAMQMVSRLKTNPMGERALNDVIALRDLEYRIREASQDPQYESASKLVKNLADGLDLEHKAEGLNGAPRRTNIVLVEFTEQY